MSENQLLPPVESPPTDKLSPHIPETISAWERIRLGGDELAICASIGLAPGTHEEEPTARIVLLDVGFRKDGRGRFGPYDIDGSGQKHEFTKDYVLVRQEKDHEGRTLTFYYEIDTDTEVHIGRQGTVGFGLGLDNDSKYGEISRDHCSLTVSKNGTVTITDNGSANGTKKEGLDRVTGGRDLSQTEYGYTTNLRDYVSRAGRGHHYESKEQNEGWGHGVYAGRPIIARDTPINGGVYPVPGKHGEALVIDDVKYPGHYNQKYAEVMEAIRPTKDPNKFSLRGLIRARGEKTANDETKEVLTAVFNNVYQTLRYDLEATDAVTTTDYQKVDLNKYISRGIGVCRTQAVLGAYFLERLVKDGVINGRVSIDRNVAQTLDGVPGGHAWTRFTDEHGNVYIVDPAQKFIGSLEEAQQQGDRWDYRRTEDILKELLATSIRR